MLYITNEFSINMLDSSRRWSLSFVPEENPAKLILDWRYNLHGITMAIGNQDLAAIVATSLENDGAIVSRVPNGKPITLKSSDTLLVAQYTGTSLPENPSICWWRVKIVDF